MEGDQAPAQESRAGGRAALASWVASGRALVRRASLRPREREISRCQQGGGQNESVRPSVCGREVPPEATEPGEVPAGAPTGSAGTQAQAVQLLPGRVRGLATRTRRLAAERRAGSQARTVEREAGRRLLKLGLGPVPGAGSRCRRIWRGLHQDHVIPGLAGRPGRGVESSAAPRSLQPRQERQHHAAGRCPGRRAWDHAWWRSTRSTGRGSRFVVPCAYRAGMRNFLARKLPRCP